MVAAIKFANVTTLTYAAIQHDGNPSTEALLLMQIDHAIRQIASLNGTHRYCKRNDPL